MQPTSFPFHKLPADIKELIFSYLPHENVAKIAALERNPLNRIRWINATNQSLQALNLNLKQRTALLIRHGSSLRKLDAEGVYDYTRFIEDIKKASTVSSLILHHYETHASSFQNIITHINPLTLTALDCHVYIKVDDVEVICSHLPGLNCLKLRSIKNETLRYLPRLTQLQSLSIKDCSVNEECSQVLKEMTTLTSLNLRNGDIGPYGAAIIAALTNLTFLNIAGGYIRGRCINSIFTISKLLSLKLCGSVALDTFSEKQLANLGHLRRLRYVQGAWACKPDFLHHTSNLRSLKIKFDDEDCHPIYLSALNPQILEKLDLSYNKFEAFAFITRFTNLTTLNLDGNTLSLGEVEKMATLTNLLNLDLAHSLKSERRLCPVYEKRLKPICSFPKLVKLNLACNNLQMGATELTALKTLRVLDLYSNDISEADTAIIKTAFASYQHFCTIKF